MPYSVIVLFAVVTRGIVEAYIVFLLPTGNPALWVEITQRRFASVTDAVHADKYGPPGAFLLKRQYLLVLDPTTQYPPSKSAPGRMMPFKRIDSLQVRSPYVARYDPDQIKGDVNPGFEVPNGGNNIFFIPRCLDTGKEVRWKTSFTDGSGVSHTSDHPCYLVASNIVLGQQIWQNLKPEFRDWEIPSKKLALAPQEPVLNLRTILPVTAKRKLMRGTVALPPEVHTFLEVERRAARLVGDGLRFLFEKEKDLTKQVKTVQNLVRDTVQSYLTTANETIASLQTLTDTSLQQIRNIGDQIAGLAEAQKQAAIDELLRQLSICDQTSTVMELTSITLDCHRVSKLYDKLTAMKAAADAYAGNKVSELIAAINTTLAGMNESIITATREQLARIAAIYPEAQVAEARACVKQYLDEMIAWKDPVTGLAEKYGVQHFQATLAQAKAVIPAMKAMAGQSAVQTINLLHDYAVRGINDVQNGIFAGLVFPEPIKSLNEGKAMTERVKTGLAAPAATIAGLSRDLGAVVADSKDKLLEMAGLPKNIDLAGSIPDAKLFGVLPLREFLGVLAKGQMPSINMIETPEAVTQMWEWVMPLKPRYDLAVLSVLMDPTQKLKNIRLRILLRTKLELGKPQAIVDGQKPVAVIELEGFLGQWDETAKKPIDGASVTTPQSPEAFQIVLAQLVAAKFFYLTFSAHYRSGEDVKPKIVPMFKDVEFLGPLKFVETFQEKLKGLGGFDLVIRPDLIGIGLGIKIPPFAFGVIALKNITLNFGFLLPLQENPLQLTFSFGTWAQPVGLTVMVYTGRCFFSAALQSDGFRDLRAAFEFGGELCFDVGVASGRVSVVAGIYGRMTNGSTEIMGYLRAEGHLSLLGGIASASVEFLLGLVYQNSAGVNELRGIAEVTVHVDIIFIINVHLTLRMEKRIFGSSDSETTNLRQLRGARIGDAVPEAVPVNRVAYFERDTAGVKGRFPWESKNPGPYIRNWNSLYFSQFARD